MFKSLLVSIRERYSISTHFMRNGNTGSLSAIFIMCLSVVGVITVIEYNKLHVAQLTLKTEQVHSQRLLDIATIEAKTKIELTALNTKLKIEETKASANPYEIAAKEHESAVNVYINTTIKTVPDDTTIVTPSGITYNLAQNKLMVLAYYVGNEFGFPETIQALLLQETRAGAFGDRIGDTRLPMGKRSYGVMQMKVATARKVLKKYPALIPKYFPLRKKYSRLRDEEIIIELIQNDEFNIRSAALNFVIHRTQSTSWAQAVVGYNTGQGKANTIVYPKKHKYYVNIVRKLITEVRPFNEAANLSI